MSDLTDQLREALLDPVEPGYDPGTRLPLVVKVHRLNRKTEMYECPVCWSLITKILDHVKALHPEHLTGNGVLTIPEELHHQ